MQTYGEVVNAVALIPHMIETFIGGSGIQTREKVNFILKI